MDRLQIFLNITGIFFAIYMFGYASYTMVAGIVSIWNLYRNRLKERMENELDHDFYFPISILVPAYNEEKTIITTINNLLDLDYKIFEIVVIDDGSTDKTAQLVIDTYHLQQDQIPIHIQVPSKEIMEVYSGDIGNRSIVMIRKKNGGCKADAINAGINISRYPYFVCMDADEILQADALKYSARLFLEDDKVIAVGGLIRIANGIKFQHAMPIEMRMSRNPIVSMQILEYYRSFIASRIFHDTFNGNLNISGGYGLFNKKAVVAVGGYDPDSVGEDMDLVLKLHVYHKAQNIPYAIRYTSDAVCWTQAPFTMKDLSNQRARWHRGLVQCMWKYRVLFLNPKFGVISLISYTYYFLYELIAPFAELLGIIVMLVAYFTNRLNIPLAIFIALLYTGFCIMQTILFYIGKYFLREEKNYKGDLLWSIFISFADVFVFRPILFIVRISATLNYKRKLHSWSKIEREDLEEEGSNELKKEA